MEHPGAVGARMGSPPGPQGPHQRVWHKQMRSDQTWISLRPWKLLEYMTPVHNRDWHPAHQVKEKSLCDYPQKTPLAGEEERVWTLACRP